MVPAVGLTILSGGQSGVDRGALDAALEFGVRAGGWCPEGRRAEDGAIPRRYPLTPLPGGDNAARTLRNVLDSDGTVVIHHGPPRGGTELTRECCIVHARPMLLIDAGQLPVAAAADRLAAFAASLPRGLLNVAGPRASEWPQGHAYARAAISEVLRALEIAPASVRHGGPAPWLDSQCAAPSRGDGTAQGSAMQARLCRSCAAPLDMAEFVGPSDEHCRYCVDESGVLRNRKEVRDGIARWMRSWQPDLGKKEARRRARRYMRAMPDWAD